MRGGGHVDLTFRFFAKTQKVFELGNSNFLVFLTNTFPSLIGTYTYCPGPQAYYLNVLCTYTELNLYLNLLPVIGFQHFVALWKAYNNSKQNAQFVHRRL